ncbi:exonuclease [Erwinia phage Stepyanka]|uniref:Exonuclease n=1 Tax=Erwinia phage Stepyanka TaxID=2961688 RepID=A0A9E7NPW2_9CAUD|nr:exonuclease [Erwinia phage Stepyanka]
MSKQPLTLAMFEEYRRDKPGAPGVLVLDGDWLVFQAMSASEVETDWGDDHWTLECDHLKAWNILSDSIKSYASRKKPWRTADIVLAFTDTVNWRKLLVDETYKENRKASRKPVGYRAFLERVFGNDEWISLREDSLEGDDIMGIIGSNPKPFNYRKAVLVSCDKDFKTIPDCDFLWCTTGNILSHDLAQADYWHMFQTIKGDITDGYGGIPGWGETAAEFLEAPYFTETEVSILKSGKNKGQEVTKWVKREQGDKSLWECMVSIAAKAGMSEEDLIKQAQMARILRHEDYNWIDKEIYLWKP